MKINKKNKEKLNEFIDVILKNKSAYKSFYKFNHINSLNLTLKIYNDFVNKLNINEYVDISNLKFINVNEYINKVEISNNRILYYDNTIKDLYEIVKESILYVSKINNNDDIVSLIKVKLTQYLLTDYLEKINFKNEEYKKMKEYYLINNIYISTLIKYELDSNSLNDIKDKYKVFINENDLKKFNIISNKNEIYSELYSIYIYELIKEKKDKNMYFDIMKSNLNINDFIIKYGIDNNKKIIESYQKKYNL